MKRKLSQQHLFFIHFSYSHLLVLLLQHYHIQAQPNITGYPCSPTQSTSPCQTYAFYRAKPPDPLDSAPQPDLLDLSTIADLFGVSRLMITKASNISSLTSPLLPNQSLLVPITCSCNSNYNMSFSNLTYTIKQFDTFYRVSTGQFQNLTTYQAVELVNPSLVPTNLDIGIDVFFPIFCKCPNSTQLMNNVTYLISYVFQPSDNLSAIAAMFGSDSQSLTSLNEKNIHPFDTVFVPVSRIPQLKQPPAVPLSPPPLSPPRRTERREVIIGLSVGLAITGFLLILLIAGIGIWFYRESLKRSGRRRGEEEKKYRLGRMKSSIEEENLMADVSECLDKYRVFGIQAVREATNDFDPSCLIQGSVYKGCMNGEFYAIKRMKWNACEELKILQKVNHGNLVKLEGFCIDREEGNCYLVYEYVENGSLHQWLHGDRANKKKLDWKTRLRIAIDVANGLQYIHEHTRPKVVHKDIKSSNILLDGNMRAKIANFGLAKSGCNAITMHIVGTQGYIAPEYLADGIVTTKMDVFAFGVVLLELISGKEAINEEGKVIWMTVDRILEDREDKKYQKLTEWMDEALVEESCSIESVMNVMAVAVACIQKDASSRPNMVDIVYTLCKSDDLYFDFSQDGLSVTPLSAR